MTAPVRLEQLSTTQIAGLLADGADFLILPIGATEQHGPHLPINTDSVIAERICLAAAEKTGVPLLPVIAYTVSSGHTAKWPGTFSLGHEAFIASICQIAEWAGASGWKRLLLVNSHFGNDASLRVVLEKIRLQFFGKLQIGLQHTFLLSPAIQQYFVSDAEDLHANRAETDLMLHLAPDSVDMTVVEDDPDRTEGTVFSYPVAQTSLNGITGSPSLGDAKRGAELFEEMTTALSVVIEKARTEEPPLPAEHWAHIPTPL